MIGIKAKRVNFNYYGIQAKTYSRDLVDEWEAAMKHAILTDVTSEGIPGDQVALVSAHRYGQACEQVITDLVFWCKWHYLPKRPWSDESKG
jgi:hypothetical protein